MSTPYAFVHNGKAYSPDGLITDVNGVPLDAKDAEAYNKALEEQELAWIRTHPDKLTLYIRHKFSTFGIPYKPRIDSWPHSGQVTTWTGTVLSGNCFIGSPKRMGFQGWNGGYRCPVDCTIYGVRYTGWWMYSSGDYVRLKKAKRQKG